MAVLTSTHNLCLRAGERKISQFSLSQFSFKNCRFYHNNPKFSNRYVWANSTVPDQTAPRGAV